ncbi:MAG: hypothetical protein A9Z00_09810 [Thermobacillus sp. ZCTH02-B1]|nr:MAG: hypothetical protein A9Z00_09810 [Thermobacillus sp. ZCTH02-B1]
MSKIIRDYRKEYEVVEARNGEEALGICRESKVDIVFSDIRMPKLDGLGLLERICEQNPDTRLVVVSGYSDFAYAQKALDLRVFRYILKPIEDRMIGETIRQIEEDIRKDWNIRHEREALAEHLKLMRPFYRDYLLNKWLKGDCTRSEWKEIENLLQNHGSGYVIVTSLGHPESEDGGFRYTAEEWNEIRWNFRMWMNETLQSYGHVVSFFLHQDTNMLVSLVVSSEGTEFTCGRLRAGLQALADNLHKEYGTAIAIGVGQVRQDLFPSVREGFRTAEIALRCRFYMDDQKVVCYSDIENRYSEEFHGSFPFEDEIKPYIFGQKPFSRAGMEQLLESGLKRLTGNRFPDPELLMDHVRGHLIQLLHSIQSIIPEESASRLAQTVNRKFHLAYVPSYPRLKKQWLDLLEEMAVAVQAQKENKNNLVMERCLHYIHSHLGEEFSLEDLAQKHYYNASYFSTLFKKYTGMNFTEYVTQLRVETAYRILLETDKKIYEVAQEVGYKDVKYFIKLFKKHYGLTPEECRVFGKGRE